MDEVVGMANAVEVTGAATAMGAVTFGADEDETSGTLGGVSDVLGAKEGVVDSAVVVVLESGAAACSISLVGMASWVEE